MVLGYRVSFGMERVMGGNKQTDKEERTRDLHPREACGPESWPAGSSQALLGSDLEP